MALYEVLAARGEAEAGAAAHVVSLLEAGSGPQRETITLVLLHIRWQQCIIAPRELKYRRMKLHFEHSVVQVRGNWGYGGASRGAQRPRCSPRRPHPLGEAEAYNRRAPSEHHASAGYFGRGSLRRTPRETVCVVCSGGLECSRCLEMYFLRLLPTIAFLNRRAGHLTLCGFPTRRAAAYRRPGSYLTTYRRHYLL